MPQRTLEFIANDAQAGFRLARLEVFNWGTFHRAVWTMRPGGENSLLTGDIGSGKSTLVDAITTLLVPHQRIVYNRAAGAENRERSLHSYVRGEYKSEKDELSRSARAVALREKNTYTVLLAYFTNEGLRQGVSLAQVFWLREGSKTPDKFFVTADADLSIAVDFAHFGDDILTLKKRLRRDERVNLTDTFKDYSTRFRHSFGIKNEQALYLFYQTVSMKSVGNLTEFVRDHMLERYDAGSRIESLSRNFDNLNQAHETVLRARRQIEMLSPLARDGRRLLLLEGRHENLQKGRDALDAYFAAMKVELLRARIEHLQSDHAKLLIRVEKSKKQIAGMRTQQQDLRESIEQEGGGRIRQVDTEIERLEAEKTRKLVNHRRYLGLVKKLELDERPGDETFLENRRRAEDLQTGIESSAQAIEQELVDLKVELRRLQEEEWRVLDEVRSLTTRKNNIPLASLRIRDELALTLGVDVDEIPFIGELVRVSQKEQEWEGAIERLLHGFALSLLVPERLYHQVSRFVDKTHLKGRLVYFRVPAGVERASPGKVRPDALIAKLDLKHDSVFFAWLDREIRHRFDYVCASEIAVFHHEPRALTINGQIKSSASKHEKDDRHALTDRSRYVLGWDNQGKIKALKEQAGRVQREGAGKAAAVAQLDADRRELTGRRDQVRDLLGHTDFQEIDWGPLADEIEIWLQEKRELEKSSDLLHELRARLKTLDTAIMEEEERRDRMRGEQGGIEEAREQAAAALLEAGSTVETLPPPERERWFDFLGVYRRRALGEKTLTLQNLDVSRMQTRETVQARIDACRKRIESVRDRLSRRLSEYRHAFPAETNEMGTDLEALDEYVARLRVLRDEDLPRHETRFKEMLNKETINSIALFQNQLEKEYQDILDNIRNINRSLREIEYNPGSYIELVGDQALDADIRDFRESLRQCLSHGLNEDGVYTEQKFLQVKAIIERFNGREGTTDLDRRWTERVTDVRNWFAFSAVERWAEDDSEKEFYSDSAGKSGGQKEKLAYTILASALAFQFGLEWQQVQSRSFRFVVIDEAFGRGSDDSTRFGLELFKKLNLQLLIVTPLQKIHIIEDYVRSVHFVHNEGGRNSVVQNMTLSEYRENKKKFQARVG